MYKKDSWENAIKQIHKNAVEYTKRQYKKKKNFSDIHIKANQMLHEHDTPHNNVIATLSTVRNDTHHIWTPVS